MERERNLSWLDFSINPILSPDGRMLLFDEESSRAGVNYATCLRKTADALVVMLGEGYPQDLSRDGKWSLSLIYGPPQRVVAYPIGPGEVKEIASGDLANYQSAGWFPDGNRVLLCGWNMGETGRCYVKSVDGGSPAPVTPEGMYRDAIISPEGKRVLVRDDAGRGLIYPVDGGEPVEVQGLTSLDEWIRWSTDGSAILVFRDTQLPAIVERVDIASGHRQHVLTIEPLNRSSLLKVGDVTLADDNTHYAYSVWRTRTKLFTIEGLR